MAGDTSTKGKALPTFKGPPSQTGGISYSDWRYKVKARGTKFWKYLSGKEDALPEGDDVLKAYGELFPLMVDSLQGAPLDICKGLGDGESDARSLLKALDNRYLSQSMSSRMMALRELVGSSQGEKSVLDYVNRKRQILREELLGAVTADELLMGSILCGLDQSYDDLTATLLNGEGTTNVDINDLVTKLQEKEKRSNDRKEIDTQSSTALKTSAGDDDVVKRISDAMDKKIAKALQTKGFQGKKRFDKNKVQKGGEKRKCFNCNKHGHLAKDCKMPNRRLQKKD